MAPFSFVQGETSKSMEVPSSMTFVAEQHAEGSENAKRENINKLDLHQRKYRAPGWA